MALDAMDASKQAQRQRLLEQEWCRDQVIDFWAACDNVIAAASITRRRRRTTAPTTYGAARTVTSGEHQHMAPRQDASCANGAALAPGVSDADGDHDISSQADLAVDVDTPPAVVDLPQASLHVTQQQRGPSGAGVLTLLSRLERDSSSDDEMLTQAAECATQEVELGQSLESEPSVVVSLPSIDDSTGSPNDSDSRNLADVATQPAVLPACLPHHGGDNTQRCGQVIGPSQALLDSESCGADVPTQPAVVPEGSQRTTPSRPDDVAGGDAMSSVPVTQPAVLDGTDGMNGQVDVSRGSQRVRASSDPGVVLSKLQSPQTQGSRRSVSPPCTSSEDLLGAALGQFDGASQVPMTPPAPGSHASRRNTHSGDTGGSGLGFPWSPWSSVRSVSQPGLTSPQRSQSQPSVAPSMPHSGSSQSSPRRPLSIASPHRHSYTNGSSQSSAPVFSRSPRFMSVWPPSQQSDASASVASGLSRRVHPRTGAVMDVIVSPGLVRGSVHGACTTAARPADGSASVGGARASGSQTPRRRSDTATTEGSTGSFNGELRAWQELFRGCVVAVIPRKATDAVASFRYQCLMDILRKCGACLRCTARYMHASYSLTRAVFQEHK